jgi:hypothetical protein
MRDFPEIVRSSVLDSPVPIQMNLLSVQDLHFNAVLEYVFERCATVDECRRAFPGLRKDLDTLIKRLEDEISGFASHASLSLSAIRDAGHQQNIHHRNILFTLRPGYDPTATQNDPSHPV